MASVMNAKTVDSVPPGAPFYRPSKIPVRTGHSSGSASEDSDNSSKSESKSRTGGKSHIPVPVKSPAAKKAVHSSKPAKTSGSESDPEKNSTKAGVKEKVVPTTEEMNIKSEENDTAAEPIKRLPARLKSMKLKKTSSVNKARCVDNPLSRSVIPGINKKQARAKPSADALAFVQQGRLRPARKFQVKKEVVVTDGSSEEELPQRPSGGISCKTSYRNMLMHSPDENQPKKELVVTDESSEEELPQRPPGGISCKTSYRNMLLHSPDEKQPKPSKKVNTVGPKDPSKRNERPSSSRTGAKSKTVSKPTKGTKSDQKSKDSDSESDNSLGLKPKKISFNYEAESDDPISTDSEVPCAPKETQSWKEVEEKIEDDLGLRCWSYDEVFDPISTDSEASCAPIEAQSRKKVEEEKIEDGLGLRCWSYDEVYDPISTDSEASCAPMEAQSKKENSEEGKKDNEPFMADILWLRERKIEFEEGSDFFSTDSESGEKDQTPPEKDALSDQTDSFEGGKKTEEFVDTPIFQQTEGGAITSASFQEMQKDASDDDSSDSFWDICPNKPAKVRKAPVQDPCSGILKASNETADTTAGKPGSQDDQPSGKSGSNKKDVAGGSSSGQGSSVGGSGDGDDPNDPKKPKPRKEPEDKKGEDDDKNDRAAKKALDKQVGITDEEGSLQETKASQTEEEGSVEALQKTIRSKDKEIALMQNLVDCCRKDYEELQESFDRYTNDFKEVDENRAKISALANKNKILKQENSKLKNQIFDKTSEATQAQERSKKLKNMLSKMEVDLDFLETEKKELLTKLKLYEANTPPEKVEAQKAEDKKEAEKSRSELGLGRSCSLQDVEAMKAEEENVELKNKLHQCEASMKAQKKECADLKDKVANITKKDDELKSRIKRLTEENDVLNSKCSQLARQWKEASIGDRIEDLRKLQGEIFEASKDLEGESTGENEVKVTSSPLSVELAEADTFGKTQQPGVSQGSQSKELQTMVYSLTAMTEELRERIKKSKERLAKARDENDNIELLKKNHEEVVKKLKDDASFFHEKLIEDAHKMRELESMIKSSEEERHRLDEHIDDLETELCKAEENLIQTTTYKDRELDNLKQDIKKKELKVEEMVGELKTVLEGNDLLRTSLQNKNSKLERKESEEKELKNYIDELELENERLLKEQSEQKIKLLDARREIIENEGMPRVEFENLLDTLKIKMESVSDFIDNIVEVMTNDPFIQEHPCLSDIECTMQLLYDIYGLMKTIGNACMKAFGCSCSRNGNGQSPGPSTEEHETVEKEHLEAKGEHKMVEGRETMEGDSRVKELESKIDDLQEQIKNLRGENLRLEKKVKEKRVRFTEDTKGGEADEILRLREQLQEREAQLGEMEQQMMEMQAENDTLTDYLNDVRDKAVFDTESLRRQTEMQTNHIQRLQKDCENQRIIVKSIQGELSECVQKNVTLNKMLKDVEAEKEALERKLEAVEDNESSGRQTEIHLNHIQKLQRDCENQRLCVKNIKSEVSELKNDNETLDKKLKEVEAEKLALEQTLKALNQEIQKGTATKAESKGNGGESLCVTPSTSGDSEAHINELQGFNEKLSEKIYMYEAFFEQVKEDKAQSTKALEASRQNAMALRKKSDEQIAELEKTLSDKNVLETKLQDTVTSLEKRISIIEAEKQDNESQMKAMVESMQGQNELEKCKEEWKHLELELRSLITALTTEKSETQKELEEQKSVVAKASESLEIRMKELDACLQDRQALQEELACLKTTHAKQKEEVDKKLEKMGVDVEKREAEMKLVRQSSSEIINELEKQLKDRRDSEIELKERAEVLNQQIIQLEGEKLESDKKIRALVESIDARENEAQIKSLGKGHELKERLPEMEARMSELVKEKQDAEDKAQHDIMHARKESEEKITALEKHLQEQSDSETMLQEKVQSLELRISQMVAEKAERDENMKTLMEAMNANKNLQEKLRKKEEMERQLSSKVEELRLKFSRIRSTKKHLEHQLAKKHSEIVTSSRKSTHHSKKLQGDLDECLEREKELNERLRRLSEGKEKESSDDKIKALEKQLLSKGQSEQEVKEKMASLEEKITRLETERSQHCKNISSIIRKLKTKEDLGDAITARDEAEREYKIKIDEMEVIVNKLRKEKNKADCDEELKERYRMEYEESRRNVRKLTEKVNKCNERVKELQAFVTGSDDEGEKAREIPKPTLHENIEDLRQTLKASDVELFKTLQSLNEKITKLEDEKAEGEKMITAMLKSMEDKEKMEHCIETSREADKKMIQQMNEMAEAIKKLRAEKKRIEHELQNSEKLRAAKECESELLQSQTDEKISSLQQSLKAGYESEWEIQKRTEAMSEKLAQMESAKEHADKTIQTMLESLQWKDNLEQCLEEKDKIEKELKRRVQELKLENKEAFMEAKKYQVQCRDMFKMKEQITSLKEQLLQKEYDKDEVMESMEKLLQKKEEELLQMKSDKDKALEDMKDLLQQKVEQMKRDKGEAMESMEKLLQKKEEELLQMESEKQKAIESMKDLLQQKVEQMERDKGEAIETMEKKLQKKKEQLLQMESDKDKAIKSMKDLLQQKVEQMERDKGEAIETMEKKLQKKKEQLLQMESDKKKAIESMKQLLQQKEEQLELVEKTLKEEVLKLKLEKKDLEIERKKSQIHTRDAFELIKKQSDEFDECLNERNQSSDRMMAEMENLKESLTKAAAERDELENKAKKYAKLSEECKGEVVDLHQKLFDAQKVIKELQGEKRGYEEELIKTRLEKTETVNSYEGKIKKLCQTLKLQSDQEKDLRHMIDSLRKQAQSLEDEKENIIQEGSKIVESLNTELEMQSNNEIELREQLGIFENEINQMRKELDDKAKREEELREQNIQEIQNIRSESANLSEGLRTKISELNKEMIKHMTKENDLRFQIESARVEKDKLLLEIEELKNDKSSSTSASRKLINELKNSERELLDKVDELNLTVRTLEGEKRRISNEYKDYQLEILHITKMQNPYQRMTEDINTLRNNNNNLHAQLREIKLKESCLLKQKQELELNIKENEDKVTRKKIKIEKQKTEITRLVDRERELKDEIIELKSKLSAAEYEKVQDKAECKSRESSLLFNTKVANAKIEDLQFHIKKRYNIETQLKDKIQDLKDKISDLNQTVESEQLDKAEITRRHSLTKGHMVELENSIENKDQEIQRLHSSSEELRAQVHRLQQEKQQISNSLEASLTQKNAELHFLEGRLSGQEALADSVFTCNMHLRDDLIRIRQAQERIAQVF